jgi:hypothetical protein
MNEAGSRLPSGSLIGAYELGPLLAEDDGRLFIVDIASKQPREIHAALGASLNAPALMAGDTANYSVRTRLERDIWMATLR